MHKIFLASLILLSPLPVLSEIDQEIDQEIDEICLSSVDYQKCESSKKPQINIQPLNTEDKKHTTTQQKELNTLSQYGIIDYGSAVTWCRKKISENFYDYQLQIERINTHPADFCRKHFIPSIQSKSGNICVECDLDPNLILANLVETIKQPTNRYGSDIDISEEIYSEGNFTPPTYISENSKSFSDQPEENSKSFSDQPEENSKGAYFTGSIGASKIGDIEVQNISSDIEFDAGLGLDLGIGYDFGRTRLEASWVRGQSDGVSWLGYSIASDSRIDSLLVSFYYDFRDNQNWSPFIGASIGSTNVDIDSAEDTGVTYGLGYGLSYKASEVMDVFIKGQTMVIPALDFGTISIENGNYTNGTIGIRYRF